MLLLLLSEWCRGPSPVEKELNPVKAGHSHVDQEFCVVETRYWGNHPGMRGKEDYRWKKLRMCCDGLTSSFYAEEFIRINTDQRLLEMLRSSLIS